MIIGSLQLYMKIMTSISKSFVFLYLWMDPAVYRRPRQTFIRRSFHRKRVAFHANHLSAQDVAKRVSRMEILDPTMLRVWLLSKTKPYYVLETKYPMYHPPGWMKRISYLELRKKTSYRNPSYSIHYH